MLPNSAAAIEESAYQENKLTTQNNIGAVLLQKMGWTEGEGLGPSGQGIVNPIGKYVIVCIRGLHLVLCLTFPVTSRLPG